MGFRIFFECFRHAELFYLGPQNAEPGIKAPKTWTLLFIIFFFSVSLFFLFLSSFPRFLFLRRDSNSSWRRTRAFSIPFGDGCGAGPKLFPRKVGNGQRFPSYHWKEEAVLVSLDKIKFSALRDCNWLLLVICARSRYELYLFASWFMNRKTSISDLLSLLAFWYLRKIPFQYWIWFRQFIEQVIGIGY